MTAPAVQDSSLRGLWNSPVGQAYTDAWVLEPAGVDELWQPIIGRGRAQLLAEYVRDIPRDARILEVGCNVGNQLQVLWALGFRNLLGVDFQRHAVETANRRRPWLDVREAAAGRLPFDSGAFDLVYTSGVLIHIPPAELDGVLAELVRVSRRWVLGYEYWAPVLEEIPWLGGRRVGRGPIGGAMWRGPYRVLLAGMGLREIRSDRLRYIRPQDSGRCDEMYLMETSGAARGAVHG